MLGKDAHMETTPFATSTPARAVTPAPSAVVLGLPEPNEIRRFGWVEPWLARGAAPSARGWRWLADNEFDIAVNLRMRKESKAASKANPRLHCIHIPVKNNCAPTDEQALRWLQICKANHRRSRIFIHCDLGEGRTSTFVALFQIAQILPLDEVIRAQQRYGFKPDTENKLQARYLADFSRRVQNNELLVRT